MLTRLDGDEAAKKKRSKPASRRQEHAVYGAAETVIIDRGRKGVPIAAWNEADARRKSPDLTPEGSGETRHGRLIQEKGLVVVDKWTVWIIKDRRKTVEHSIPIPTDVGRVFSRVSVGSGYTLREPTGRTYGNGDDVK